MNRRDAPLRNSIATGSFSDLPYSNGRASQGRIIYLIVTEDLDTHAGRKNAVLKRPQTVSFVDSCQRIGQSRPWVVGELWARLHSDRGSGLWQSEPPHQGEAEEYQRNAQ